MNEDTNIRELELQVLRQMLLNLESTVMALGSRVSLVEQLTQEGMRNQVSEQATITHLKRQVDKIKIDLNVLTIRDKARGEKGDTGSGSGNRLRPR